MMDYVASSPRCPKTDDHHTVREAGIYSRAQDKARTMQYAIRSGRPRTEGEKEKKQRYHDDGETLEKVKGEADARVIKKPRSSKLHDTPRGKGSCRHELPKTAVQLDVIWIPENKKGRDSGWVKTITFRSLLQQLEKQKVKLLLDQEDESTLVIGGGDSDDDCNED